MRDVALGSRGKPAFREPIGRVQDRGIVTRIVADNELLSGINIVEPGCGLELMEVPVEPEALLGFPDDACGPERGD